MINLEIPDPFDTFVSNKYKDFKGMLYDFFAQEWHMNCLCCNEDLYAPSKNIMTKMRLYHTRNECMGGY